MRQASKFWTEHTCSDRIARERAFGALISLSVTKRLKRLRLLKLFTTILIFKKTFIRRFIA